MATKYKLLTEITYMIIHLHKEGESQRKKQKKLIKSYREIVPPNHHLEELVDAKTAPIR